MHGKIKIINVEAACPYHVFLVFDDGSESRIDLEPILHGKMYGALRDKNLFRQVEVNTEVGTIEWPNGADFDPETLYNWEDYKVAWLDAVKKWKTSQEV